MKRSLLAGLLIVFALSAHAQISVGPRVGINWNSFRGNKAFDVIPGLTIGGFGRYPVLPFLTAKAELGYVQQGANLIDYNVLPGDLYRNNAQVVFHTMQLAAIGEFGLPSLAEEGIQPKLSVGVAYSQILYSRERYMNVATINGYEPVAFRGHSKVSDQFRKNQWSLIGAIGTDVKVMSQPVYLEFRYQHNIGEIANVGGGYRSIYNMTNTFDEWGDNLYIGTVSFNVAVTIAYF
jgi:hypothetical protein